tara:strand:- start:15906 stop:16853 length:948 start_codon:yes stop_codon:yes gene_type:complete
MANDDKYRDLPSEIISNKYPHGLKDINFAPSTLETVDYSIFDYMDQNINFHVTTNKGFEKVPIIWVASERSHQIKRKKELRDDEGTIIMPVITIERSAVSKSLKTRGAYYGGQFINKDEKGGALVIARRIKQDKTAKFNNADQNRRYPAFAAGTGPKFVRRTEKKKVVYETISIPPIVYVDITYQITLRTEYQQQMNELVQVFATRPGIINHLMLERDGHRYEAFVQENFAQANNLSAMDNAERKFETKVDIKVLGYLVGEGENEERPKFSVRESCAEVRFQRERDVFGDSPEYSGDGKLRGDNPYSSDRTGYIE